MDKKIGNVIALVITVVWAVSFIADILMTTYEPSPYIHAIMMTVAGAVLTSSALGGNGKGKDK